MPGDVPSVSNQSKSNAVPTDNTTSGCEQGTAAPGDSDDRSITAREFANDRPYGFAIAAIGAVAAFINAVLVGVLLYQTWAVHGQLQLSREALKRSNESFQDTLAEMRMQRDAMTAQVESVRILTSTLEQVFRDQQRARLSFRVELEEIDDVQTGIRVVCPFEIGGTTEARQVRFKNYVSEGAPGHRQHLDDLALDWNLRESYPLSDVDPTEEGRRFITPVLSPARMRAIVSQKESLYFVGRLEYCDIYGICRYFMRCAELGYQPRVISYCGTRVGNLDENRK